MACGTPVVSSNSSSLPEVVGDAGLLVDPTDTAALSQAMHRTLSDADLRTNLSQRSLTQAHKFSWQKAVDELEGIYRTLRPKIAQ
jgi:glycosyltransferase involved in cell wall biosynthesis